MPLNGMGWVAKPLAFDFYGPVAVNGAKFIYPLCISVPFKSTWGNSWSLKIFDLVRNCLNAVSQRCRRAVSSWMSPRLSRQ